jgi:hypothetical protein
MKTKQKKEFHAMDEEQEITVRGCNLYVTFEIWNPHIANSGIGSYEFWGAKGFDAGTDYLEEFEIRNVKVYEIEQATKETFINRVKYLAERAKMYFTPKKTAEIIEEAIYTQEEKTHEIEEAYMGTFADDYDC